MHDKLSQAVKLYDNLLTEQFAQSSRKQHMLAQPSYPSYLPPVQQQPQIQWTPQPAIPYGAYQSTQTVPTSPTNVEQRWSRAPVSYQPEPTPGQQPYNPERSVVSPPPMQPVSLPTGTSYEAPQQHQSADHTSLPPVTLPPVSLQSPYQPQQTTAVPDIVSQKPVALPNQAAPVQQHLSLSRHSTIQSYHPANASLKRANTVASSHSQVQQPRSTTQPYIPQRTAAVSPPPSAPPTSLPVLPTAPTNAPSAYSLYGPGVSVPTTPASAPVSEPKEAMLISFD